MSRHALSEGEWIDYTLSASAASPKILVIYVHGFASHQRGDKALYFRDRFAQRGVPYLAFDFRGHGSSSGRIRDLTISRCIEDLSALVDGPAKGYAQVVLIGSSMGGQVAAWVAARRPERVGANLLIAPSFLFYENRLRDLGDEGLKTLERRGEIRFKNRWLDVVIGKGLIEDAARYSLEELLARYQTPTLIFHGTADESVPHEGSVQFVQRSRARPLDLLLIAGGDHRLTSAKEHLFEQMWGFCRGRAGLAFER